MKLEILLTKTAKFTDLIRITDFDSIEHCLKLINSFFNTDPDYPYYTEDEEGKDYKYVYLAGDGQACFVEQLSDFDEGYRTEQDWDVSHSIIIN